MCSSVDYSCSSHPPVIVIDVALSLRHYRCYPTMLPWTKLRSDSCSQCASLVNNAPPAQSDPGPTLLVRTRGARGQDDLAPCRLALLRSQLFPLLCPKLDTSSLAVGTESLPPTCYDVRCYCFPVPCLLAARRVLFPLSISSLTTAMPSSARQDSRTYSSIACDAPRPNQRFLRVLTAEHRLFSRSVL